MSEVPLAPYLVISHSFLYDDVRSYSGDVIYLPEGSEHEYRDIQRLPEDSSRLKNIKPEPSKPSEGDSRVTSVEATQPTPEEEESKEETQESSEEGSEETSEDKPKRKRRKRNADGELE